MWTLSFKIENENKPALIELLKGLEPIEVRNYIQVTEYSWHEKEAQDKINEIEGLIECEGVCFFDEQEGDSLDDYINDKYFY